MITTTQMYWLTRLDAIGALSTVMIVLGVGVTVSATVIYASTLVTLSENERRVLRNILRVFISTLVLGIAVNVFVPNTKEMAAIWVVPKLANSESLSDIADGVKTLATEWLEELRPGKDGK